MKHQKAIVLALLAIALFTLNCKKESKDDSSTNFLLVYLLDQTSGNCATISKNTAGTIYTASGSTVPKGGCNETTLNTTLYTTSPAAAKTAVDTFFDGGKAIYDTYSACSAFSTALTTAKAAVTETTITTTQSGLTSGNTGCANVGTYTYRISSGKWSSVQICKDDASITAVKALTQYSNVTSIATDMETSLTSKKTALTAAKSTNGFSDTQILTLVPYGATELSTFSSANYLAALLAQGTTACATAIVSADSSIKTYLATTQGITSAYGVTQSDVSSISIIKTSPLSPVQCQYGSGFTTATASVGVCPSTYTRF